MILTKEYLEMVIETQGWYVDFTEENCAELSFNSLAGEDFRIMVFFKTLDDFPRAVMQAACDFDPEKHVEMWMEAKRNGVAGVPSIYDLVHDADDIQENLDDLATELCNDLEFLKTAKEDC